MAYSLIHSHVDRPEKRQSRKQNILKPYPISLMENIYNTTSSLAITTRSLMLKLPVA